MGDLCRPLVQLYHALTRALDRATMPGECSCAAMDVNVCNGSGLATLLARLPERLGPGSPWAGYLRAVYGKTPPTGFPLGRLELLYSNLLPLPRDRSLQHWQRHHCTIAHGSGPTHAPHLAEPCAESECAAWFPRPAPTAADVGRQVAYRPFRKFPSAPRLGAALMLQQSGPLRSPTPSGSWIEVVRQWPIDTAPSEQHSSAEQRAAGKAAAAKAAEVMVAAGNSGGCRSNLFPVAFHGRRHCVFPEGTDNCPPLFERSPFRPCATGCTPILRWLLVLCRVR